MAKADIDDEKIQEINFTRIVEEVFQLNNVLSQKNAVTMSKNISITEKWLFPHVRILQILNNLISNSIKYCDFDKKEKFVDITIKESLDQLEITVKDNGTGIPYDDKEEVFAMFKRYHSNKISGSGIGMYVLKKHVDALGGEISFESNNQGSCFNIILHRFKL